MNTVTINHPQIKIIPPILFAAYVGLGLLANSLFPYSAIGSGMTWLSVVAELMMLEAAIIIMMAMRSFRKSATPVATWKPAVSLLTTGIFRFSRNPIYLGMLLAYIGLALLLVNIWLLLLTIPLYLQLLQGVILKEEYYLAQTFAKDYLDYKTRVNRWISFK
ncbi:MAG: isoprenylcysteine carboxylmethyltransferase family protein [Thiohalomonadales bacterium]